ncbi:MAG TPA: hypothetical protein VF283_13355 [Bryobacteraceae bacterium]
MQERRTDTRLLCADLVELIWKDEANREHRRVANLEDISLSGLCLCAEQGVSEGTDVRVHYGDGELVGVVRYCIFRSIGFILGVEFREGCRWSTQHFQPQHMIDPRQLVCEAMARHGSPMEALSVQ